MNHCTTSAIDQLLTRCEDIYPESNTNTCDGQPRAPFVSPEPNNVFMAWDAWHLLFEQGPDRIQLAIDTLKNIDCPICRTAIDAAFEGIDLRKMLVLNNTVQENTEK